MKNYRVQVFDSKDTFVRQWGSLGIALGQFSETVPGIAIDTNNRVYVVDKINSHVHMFDNTGNYLSSWGSDGKGPQQLHKPEDIAVNNQGEDIYITDTRNSRVQILQVIE
jgi:DNA-binding beta-propeller fold protein YncE